MISHIKKYLYTYSQVMISFFTLIIFVFLLYKPLMNFNSLDPFPAITQFTPEEIKSVNPKTIVKTGLYIKDFSEFDVRNNKFKLEAILSFEYDPQAVTLEQLQSFHFERGEITYRSHPARRRIGKRELVYYSIMVKFDNDMIYRRFPLDDHQLHIVFQNLQLSPQEVMFQSSDNRFIVKSERYISAWKGINTFTTSGYVEEILERADKPQTNVQYPRIIFSIDYSRYSLRSLFLILLPLLAIFLIGIFSMIPFREELYGTRLMMCTSVLSALILYLFAITPNVPSVGYMMISDYMYIYVLLSAILIFGVTLACKFLPIGYRVIFNICLNTGLISLWYYLLYIQ